MLDEAGYKGENQNAFVNLQIQASPRTEIVATTQYNRGLATIRDFNYDSTNIVPIQAAGLNFPLMSSTFAGFSNLDYRTLVQAVGVNHRVSNGLVLNGTFFYNDLKDSEPYLYDTTGRRTGFSVGLNWMF